MTEIRCLYRFTWETTGGSTTGLFVAPRSEVEACIGQTLLFYAPEVMHTPPPSYTPDRWRSSNDPDLWVEAEFREEDLDILASDEVPGDSEFIDRLKKVTGGSSTISGVNPLEYIVNKDS